ncbi:MAG: YidB family protein [Ramlibacter sp.]
MSNDLLGQILGSVLSGARSGGGASASGGGLGGLGDLLGGLAGGNRGGGGGLGDVLGGMLGGGRQADNDNDGRGGSPFGGKGALLAMLLPLAMQWVQRNGGIGAVLERFQQKGYSQQAASWMSTGANQAVDSQAVGEVVGMEELSRLSQQLGVGQDEVASGLAEILPEVVNHLSPQGNLPDNADDVLGSGLSALEQLLGQARGR